MTYRCTRTGVLFSVGFEGVKRPTHEPISPVLNFCPICGRDADQLSHYSKPHEEHTHD